MDDIYEFHKYGGVIIGGAVFISCIIGPLLFLVGNRILFIHCPRCNNYKFYKVAGGPPKCMSCRWQHTESWSARYPNKKPRGMMYFYV